MIEFINEKGLIDPIGGDLGAEVAITAFSAHIFDELIKRTGAKLTCGIKGCADVDMYMFESNGKRIAVYKSTIGAPAAAAIAEEVFACGVKHLIAFGICGALVDTPPHTFIVPDKAFRDEGTSYHYLPKAEYIAIKNSAIVQRSLKSSGVSTALGGTWTTDGFYRETRARADMMKNSGCIAVDMECSALQAVADFRGKQFYTFFLTADSLAGEEWAPNDILDLKVTDSTTTAVAAAVKLAQELA